MYLIHTIIMVPILQGKRLGHREVISILPKDTQLVRGKARLTNLGSLGGKPQP